MSEKGSETRNDDAPYVRAAARARKEHGNGAVHLIDAEAASCPAHNDEQLDALNPKPPSQADGRTAER